MLILFDHGTPRGIARFLLGHTVTRAKQRGWDTLSNGDLLAEAERAGFDVFVTADKNILMTGLSIILGVAILICGVLSWAVVGDSQKATYDKQLRNLWLP